MVFADVNFSNLTDAQAGLRGHHHHTGDWPCIRYYNGETGVEGEEYIRKRKRKANGEELRLCEELGPRQFYLLEFVSEVAGSLCDVTDRERSCDEKSLRFLHTSENIGDDEVEVLEKWYSQLAYFQSQVQANPGNWENWRRAEMLQQLITQKESIEEEL